jgi:hypothetical protein
MARRGPIVDDAALLSHLRTKQIAGAGLNGYDVEPLPADYPVCMILPARSPLARHADDRRRYACNAKVQRLSTARLGATIARSLLVEAVPGTRMLDSNNRDIFCSLCNPTGITAFRYYNGARYAVADCDGNGFTGSILK